MTTPENPEMPDYLNRMYAESHDLDKKIRALGAFITGPEFLCLPRYEQYRLIAQRAFMMSYWDVLNQRIAFAWRQFDGFDDEPWEEAKDTPPNNPA